jgi:hypothetical protein
MEKVTSDKVVGFVLAALFGLVMGFSMWGLLVGETTNPNTTEQTRHILRIVGFAGVLAALTAWWVQGFAAQRSFVVRLLFALFILVVAFFSYGGMFRVIDSHVNYPQLQDWSLTGLYLSSINYFYSFVLFMLVPPRPAYAALILAAACFLAVFGPRARLDETSAI